MEQIRAYRFEEINVDDLTARDLREESEGYAKNEAGTQQAYRILVENSPEAADALYLPDIGRMGIARGPDATWADVPDVETDIEWYINDPEKWEALN